MKKMILLVMVLILTACGAQKVPVEDVPTWEGVLPMLKDGSTSPCDRVMTEEAFARTYDGKEVTFMGAYSNGVVYAFEVDGVTVCAHNFNDEVASFPWFSQDIIENDELWQDTMPIIDSRANMLIGSSGILEFETYDDGSIIDLNVRNATPMQIYGRPESCIDLDKNSVQNFNNKEIVVVGAKIDEYGWMNLYFQSEGETYCYEKAYVVLVKPVTDIFGQTNYSNSGGLSSDSLFLLMNLSGIMHFYDDQTVSAGATQFAPEDIQKIIFIQTDVIPDYQETSPNLEMFEVLSHGLSNIDYVDENNTRGKYKLINSTEKPEAVNDGYLYAPKEYLDGGEIKVGTVLGIANSKSVEVTEIVCALGGMSLVPVYSISYSGSEGNSYTLADPDSYLYLVENEGDRQTIIYYHIPALAAECPTSY